MKIMTWKYKIVPILNAKDNESLQNSMNLMGQIGWELVGVQCIKSTGTEVVIFKMPTGFLEK